MTKQINKNPIERIFQIDGSIPTEANSDAVKKEPLLVMVLDDDSLQDLFRDLGDDDRLDRDFQEKIIFEAFQFLESQFSIDGYDLAMQVDLADLRKNAYNHDNFFNQGIEISFGRLQKIFGKIPSHRYVQELVNKLNREFNVNRRLGLFILEKNNKGYDLYFNPTDNADYKKAFLSEPRSVARQLAARVFPPQNIFDSSELMTLHMEDSFMNTFANLNPNSVVFGREEESWSEGLQILFRDPKTKKIFIHELKNWNMEHNVKNRIGVFRFDSMGPFGVLWFQNSEGNASLEQAKEEMLTERRIADLEDRYSILYDPNYFDQ